MARVKRGVTAGRRHKKVLGKAKGYYNARRKVYRAAKQAVIKAGQTRFDIEHPTGHLEVEAEIDQASQPPRVVRSGVVRTARKLFDGTVFPRRSR